MTTKLMTDDQVTAVVAACEGVLRLCARDKRVIYYHELAGILPWPFEFNMGYSAHRALLGQVLFDVGKRSEAEGLGLLPALAVSKGNGRPSGRTNGNDASGFWWAAAEFGRDLSDPDRMLLDEQAAVYKALAS